MANKAVSKVILQIAIIVTLVVTANAIKPFSPSNLVLHTLAAARSFSFVLPDTAVERIEQVNYLAEAYGKSLLDGNGSNSIWANQNPIQSSLLASNVSPSSIESAEEAEIKDVKSGEPAKKSVQKRAVRRVKHDDQEDMGASEKSQEITGLPGLPKLESVASVHTVRLPVFEPQLIKARTISVSAHALPLASWPCSKSETKTIRVTAYIQQLPNLPMQKVALLLAPRPIALPQCRKEKEVETITEEAESAGETTVGPQEELFFGEAFSDPMAPVPNLECSRLR